MTDVKISWAASHVLRGAGFQLDEVDDELLELAEQCLEESYYIDNAAIQLTKLLKAKKWR